MHRVSFSATIIYTERQKKPDTPCFPLNCKVQIVKYKLQQLMLKLILLAVHLKVCSKKLSLPIRKYDVDTSKMVFCQICHNSVYLNSFHLCKTSICANKSYNCLLLCLNWKIKRPASVNSSPRRNGETTEVGSNYESRTWQWTGSIYSGRQTLHRQTLIQRPGTLGVTREWFKASFMEHWRVYCS